ncbi:RNA polymerase sigma factor [Rubrolithibacter danxiaensis]|uniref:RNA polymerase sigma factor n=1 Tax=Rubrolithibacter danxiaensis TaxID=3390805 RepID=UPI003BF873EA
MSENYQELWARFRNGDQQAYEKLIHKLSTPLYGYGMRIIHDHEFVKDCIQDVFFELWNRRKRISQTPSVKSYLFKAIRLRIFREYKKWDKTDSLDDNYHFLVEFNIETKIIEEQLSEETESRIKKILNELPKRQKEIIYLRFYEGLNSEQIAEIMGVTKQSVYNLLRDSIQRLRNEWFKVAFSILFGFI